MRGTRFNLASQFLAALAVQFWPEDGIEAEAREGRLDDQAIQMVEHVAPLVFLPAPPGRHRRQHQFLAQEVAA